MKMTKSLLRTNVIGVMLIFAVLIVVAFLLKFGLKSQDAYTVVKDFSPIVIAAAAAYLAYCFQRRQAFLVSLRDLWKEMVEAKSELIEYTHLTEPNQIAFGKAHRAISKTIDLVRGVYKNVGETDQEIGLFPLEPLHDARKALEELYFINATPERQIEARKRIIISWNALRSQFLKEFSTTYPPHPIVTRNAIDSRRGIGDQRQAAN